MTPDVLLDLARDALTTLILCASPIVMTAMVIGLSVSVFQTITQLQDQTLTFVPKIIAVFASLILMLPFMGMAMQGLMERLVERIVGG